MWEESREVAGATATGAAIGTGIGVLGDLASRGIEEEDITLKKGRKAWLRLDTDLEVPAR